MITGFYIIRRVSQVSVNMCLAVSGRRTFCFATSKGKKCSCLWRRFGKSLLPINTFAVLSRQCIINAVASSNSFNHRVQPNWSLGNYIMSQIHSRSCLLVVALFCRMLKYFSQLTWGTSIPIVPCAPTESSRVQFISCYSGCVCAEGKAKTGICIMYWLVACWGGRLCPITCAEHQLVCKGRRMMRG